MPDMLKPLIEFCKYYEDPVKKVTYKNSEYYVRWKEKSRRRILKTLLLKAAIPAV